MSHAALLLLALLCAACQRVNPAYCDDLSPCPPGQSCVLPAHRCSPFPTDPMPDERDVGPKDAAPEAPDLALGLPDLAGDPADLTPGACCGTTTCYVCASDSTSGQPFCQNHKCVCLKHADCGPGAKCITGACWRECAMDMDCAQAPQGSVCALGFPFRHCACNDDGQCPVANTRCDPILGLCKCGGTVCQYGQKCHSGVCQD